MRVLELFAGTGSVGKWCRERGHEVVSLDIDPRSEATFTCDIMGFDFMQFTPGHFDVVWASPPCTMYSALRTTGRLPRDIEGSNRIVQRTLDIIRYLQPRAWFLENPQTGCLKEQDLMAGLMHADFDYCQYGFNYRKRTRIWTNVGLVGRLCDGHCHAMVRGEKGRMRHSQAFGGRNGQIPLSMKHRVPQELISYLFAGLS